MESRDISLVGLVLVLLVENVRCFVVNAIEATVLMKNFVDGEAVERWLSRLNGFCQRGFTGSWMLSVIAGYLERRLRTRNAARHDYNWSSIFCTTVDVRTQCLHC